MVLLELQYLSELGKTALSAGDILLKITAETNLKLCDLPFPRIAEAALSETWTRDPFDRLIVAQAKANGYATLLSADQRIRRHYLEALW